MSTERVWWYDAMGCEETDTLCMDNWKIIHITALIPAVLSSIASIFIILTGILYHAKFAGFTFAAKLPIFLSICDLSFEIFHGGDHLHNLIHNYVSEGALCLLFGSMKPFWINCQTMWALAVSIYLYGSIFGKEFNFGKHNIYLHMFCWGVPSIILVAGFAAQVYGVEGPWCGIPSALPDLLMVDVWIGLTIIVMIVIYSMIVFKLNETIKTTRDVERNEQAEHRLNGMKRAMRTIGLYPVAYFIQWLAYSLYKLYLIPRTFATAIWVVSSANLGGIFNLFLYGPLLLKQIKREKRKHQKNLRASLETVPNATTSPGLEAVPTKTVSTAITASTTANTFNLESQINEEASHEITAVAGAIGSDIIR